MEGSGPSGLFDLQQVNDTRLTRNNDVHYFSIGRIERIER
jgi:hypothetical protein